MATSPRKLPKPDKYKTWTQVAFVKVHAGSHEVGIVQGGLFYWIPGAQKDQVVHLRRLNKMDARTVEYSLDPDAIVWSVLRNGRAI